MCNRDYLTAKVINVVLMLRRVLALSKSGIRAHKILVDGISYWVIGSLILQRPMFSERLSVDNEK